MATLKKARADSKLKNLAETDQETLWLLLHPTDSTVPAATMEDVRVYVLEELKVSAALSTLSEWHAWYSLKRRMEAAAERANQTSIALARDSSLTPADIERVAQTVFTAESLQMGDVGAYVKLANLRLKASKQALDRDKLTAASKSLIEKGLDALLAEIQGNPRAMKLFAQLQEVVSKA